MVQQEADTLAVLELAAWIREGRQGYRLVDLRTEQEFSAYHIPGAENIDLTALLDSGFDRNSRVVLCSGDGVLSAQAIVFLWAQGYKRVYTLKGGVAAWQREIVRQPPPAGTALNPSPTRPSPQKEPDQRDGEHFRKEC
jgi:rhodanese-related sulfurtransferase